MGKKSKLTAPPHADSDELLSLKQASEFLKIGRSSVFALVRDGAIPYSRPLWRKRVVWKSDRVEFIDNRRVAS
jgi:predicted DNA-binding transcriptional regulator AlpA